MIGEINIEKAINCGRNQFLARRCSLLLATFMLVFSAHVACQDSSHHPAGITSVQIMSVQPDPDNQRELLVSVVMTVRAGTEQIIIPTCGADISDPRHICTALLKQADGKGIGVRKGLAASMGVEDSSEWKPIALAPSNEAQFRFSFSTLLLNVNPSEKVRVGITVWPSADAMKDWKQGTTLLSPVFRCPSGK